MTLLVFRSVGTGATISLRDFTRLGTNWGGLDFVLISFTSLYHVHIEHQLPIRWEFNFTFWMIQYLNGFKMLIAENIWRTSVRVLGGMNQSLGDLWFFRCYAAKFLSKLQIHKKMSCLEWVSWIKASATCCLCVLKKQEKWQGYTFYNVEFLMSLEGIYEQIATGKFWSTQSCFNFDEGPVFGLR